MSETFEEAIHRIVRAAVVEGIEDYLAAKKAADEQAWLARRAKEDERRAEEAVREIRAGRSVKFGSGDPLIEKVRERLHEGNEK